MTSPAIAAEPLTVSHHADARVTATPNATMTTLASPGQNGTTGLCLWTVEFTAGASGPDHTMDTEQVWYLERGAVRCVVESVDHDLAPGDVIRLAGGVPRRFHADTDARFIVCGLPGALATTPTSDEGVVPPWIA